MRHSRQVADPLVVPADPRFSAWTMTPPGDLLLASSAPIQGEFSWFLVRSVNCGGSGTHDSGGVSQVGLRDAEIAASGNDCQ